MIQIQLELRDSILPVKHDSVSNNQKKKKPKPHTLAIIKNKNLQMHSKSETLFPHLTWHAVSFGLLLLHNFFYLPDIKKEAINPLSLF